MHTILTQIGLICTYAAKVTRRLTSANANRHLFLHIILDIVALIEDLTYKHLYEFSYYAAVALCNNMLKVIDMIVSITNRCIYIPELNAHCCSHYTMGSSPYLYTGLMNAAECLILWIYNSLYRCITCTEL